jgi:putative phosphoribosyl transferase
LTAFWVYPGPLAASCCSRTVAAVAGLSPRNNHVAAALRSVGLATLLFDLLTEQEAAERRNVFDIELLAERLALATAWVDSQDATKNLPIGYFGASTGAAAALVAAARLQESIRAIVSRGGRPDMAAPVLHQVRRRPCSSWAGTMSACSS